MPTPTNKEFNEISKAITKALKQFEKRIPAMEKSMAHDVNMEIFRLKKNNGQIANTVENMRIVTSIKNKIAQLLNTESYQKGTAKFLDSFNTITALQNQYWKQAEKSFKPSDMLREIREQAINDTAKKLGEQGIGVGIGDKVVDILRTNITSGGTYRQLQEQLRTALTQTETPSLLRRYVTQITTDSVHQYNAQYTQQVSSDLGYQWYAYQGSDIMTTRPFCNAMTDFRYFHISEIPRLLRGEGLTYKDPKTGAVKPVKVNKKTNLPDGMIEGTNTSNFFVRRGGYNCGHQIRPVSEKLVPLDIRNRVFGSPEYAAWAQQNISKPKTTAKAQQEEVQQKIVAKQVKPFDDEVRKYVESVGFEVTAPNKLISTNTNGFDFEGAVMLIDSIKSKLPTGYTLKGTIDADRYGQAMFAAYIRNPRGVSVLKLERSFSDNGKTVGHDYFVMKEPLKGTDVGKNIMRHFMDEYERIGVERINVHANIDIGGYVWAKYGFGMYKNSLERLKKEAELVENTSGLRNYPGLDNLNKQEKEDLINWVTMAIDKTAEVGYYSAHELAITSYGKKLLLGSDWQGQFDMKNKDAMRIFKAYLDGK